MQYQFNYKGSYPGWSEVYAISVKLQRRISRMVRGVCNISSTTKAHIQDGQRCMQYQFNYKGSYPGWSEVYAISVQLQRLISRMVRGVCNISSTTKAHIQDGQRCMQYQFNYKGSYPGWSEVYAISVQLQRLISRMVRGVCNISSTTKAHIQDGQRCMQYQFNYKGSYPGWSEVYAISVQLQRLISRMVRGVCNISSTTKAHIQDGQRCMQYQFNYKGSYPGWSKMFAVVVVGQHHLVPYHHHIHEADQKAMAIPSDSLTP